MSVIALFMVSVVVPDMDQAIAHYTGDWGFALAKDSRHIAGHRWVELSPASGARLRLVEARNEAERAVIGRQAGGRVAFFIDVADFDTSVARWSTSGIEIVEPPRTEAYGRIVVLRDKYGNRWDAFDASSRPIE